MNTSSQSTVNNPEATYKYNRSLEKVIQHRCMRDQRAELAQKSKFQANDQLASTHTTNLHC